MNDNIPEATVVMAKCRQSRRSFGIRTEKTGRNAWCFTWAFPLSDKAASHEGYDNNTISGTFDFGPEYPGCPYCGAKTWFQCGSCGRLNCLEDESFATCAWCGNSGELHSADKFDLSGGSY